MRLAPVLRWTTRGAAGLLLAALAVLPASAGGGPRGNPTFDPASEPYDLTYGEWSARHWQWEYSLPIDHHPLFDTADVSEGQSGPVWFLGGTFTTTEFNGEVVGQVTRRVTIPAGKALFFPLVDVESSTIEGNGETDAELRGFSEFIADFIVPDSLFCKIDGQHVRNLTDYRVQFGYDAPEGSTSLSVSDGVFVMLKPLAPGQHKLQFGGTVDLSSIGFGVFTQDITYHITVKR
jgi:hypothetical protein